ncbi:hypothetical protein D3C72_2424650 [compost metagenome]
MKAVMSGKLDPKGLITHRFDLDDIQQAYSTFARAERSQALKVRAAVEKSATVAAE